MDLLKKMRFLKLNRQVSILRENGKLIIDNPTDSIQNLIMLRLFVRKNNGIHIKSKGNLCRGDKEPQIALVDRRRQLILGLDFNGEAFFTPDTKYFVIALRVHPHTQVEFDEIYLNLTNEEPDIMKDFFKGDILLATPGYPSVNNKYLCGFVHTRAKEYKKLGWNFDVAFLCDQPGFQIYTYEGVRVCKISFHKLRLILQTKEYQKLLIHFFDDRFAQTLDACELSKTRIYLYSHGADTIYRDFNAMTAFYFEKAQPIDPHQEEYYKFRDRILRRYNEMPNVKFLFVTDWTRRRSEETNGIEYKNYDIVPCFVDSEMFAFKKKDPELRKKIFIIRKFDNINTYSLDINVRVILELSRRPFFSELEFYIYGDGSEHDILLSPVRQFSNVHIYKKFLTHTEIAQAHAQAGIALFATRYDSQAVSSCEAAMSGLVVISSDHPGVAQEIHPKFNTLCDTENYVEYADKIEEIYNNPQLFSKLSQEMSEYLFSIYSYEHTIQKELDLFAADDMKPLPEYEFPAPEEDILLTIAIPSYNVERYLKNSVISLINHPLAGKMEILVVNDGSRDRTAEIAKELETMTMVSGKSIVRLIDKENGGHGSTINAGIREARGKYFRLMDGDDYFWTEQLVELLEKLENEDVDVVLTNYVEDLAETNEVNRTRGYRNLEPGICYTLDDLAFSGYGFEKWGPLFSTSTYRTDMLKDAGFKITENCFYVDMELNAYIFVNAKTLKYYPLDIYIYYIGRSGQSMQKESMMRNYLMHEKMALQLINIFNSFSGQISESKKAYLLDKMIFPVLAAHYGVMLDYFNGGEKFRQFDKKLREFPDFYNSDKFPQRVRKARKSGGRFIRKG